MLAQNRGMPTLISWRMAAAGVPLIAILLSACGSRAGPTSGPTTSPSPTAASSGSTGEVAALTNSETNATRYVRVGALVEVTLTADAGYGFSAPASDDAAVLRAESSASTSTGAAAQFRALTPGTAQITATENPSCLPQCARPSRLWEATVIVTPHPVP